MRGTSISIGFSVMVSALVWAVPAWARPPAEDSGSTKAVEVPEQLKPSIPWVLHGEGEEARCPQLAGEYDKRVCAWPARLTLTLGERGGTFSQEWQVWNKGQAGLPGDKEHWPQSVRVDGKAAGVVADDDKPMVMLSPGHRLVSPRCAVGDAARRARRAGGDGEVEPSHPRGAGSISLNVTTRGVSFSDARRRPPRPTAWISPSSAS